MCNFQIFNLSTSSMHYKKKRENWFSISWIIHLSFQGAVSLHSRGRYGVLWKSRVEVTTLKESVTENRIIFIRLSEKKVGPAEPSVIKSVHIRSQKDVLRRRKWTVLGTPTGSWQNSILSGEMLFDEKPTSISLLHVKCVGLP